MYVLLATLKAPPFDPSTQIPNSHLEQLPKWREGDVKHILAPQRPRPPELAALPISLPLQEVLHQPLGRVRQPGELPAARPRAPVAEDRLLKVEAREGAGEVLPHDGHCRILLPGTIPSNFRFAEDGYQLLAPRVGRRADTHVRGLRHGLDLPRSVCGWLIDFGGAVRVRGWRTRLTWV